MATSKPSTAPAPAPAPGAPREYASDSELVKALFAAPSKLVRSSVFKAPGAPEIEVRSWRMTEHQYYVVPSPFPTLARGLFTREVGGGEEKEGEKEHEIVVRGYDKFFNIGEVPWSEWDAIEAHTAAPYNVSLKSNGCIIFIAALTPETLLITSKHSVGHVAGSPVSHAQAGEAWLRKYLAAKGREEKDMAAALWAKKWTAVAELCDDNFEEHVLGYSPEKTGLHLHGLNVSTREFETMPAETVDAFADEWGFIKTPHVSFDSIAAVREFTTKCAERGEWNGEPVEGFVVRTHVTQPSARSPYKAGSSFFFKVKFDEPYMMYRDWREVTKRLLANDADPSTLPKSKMRRPETALYVKWVVQEIRRNPDAFKHYNKNKGIIATRERYFEFLKSDKGAQELEEIEKDAKPVVFGKTVIVPVAIPGCGKTAVGVALAHIFGFGHTQSDDVQAKKPAPIFLKNVKDLLAKHDVVIADKNNHFIQHRKALRDAVSDIDPPVRLLALNWALDAPQATVHRICASRVQERGENHQTLRPDKADPKRHEEVLWQFINTAEELTPSEVDAVVDMELEEETPAAVRRAADGVADILGLPRATEAQIAEALEKVAAYVPKTKQVQQQKKKPNTKKPRYYGLLPEIDLVALLDTRMGAPDAPPDMAAFWAALKQKKRYPTRPHVTLVHRNSMEEEKELWERSVALAALPRSPVFKARLGSVLCNGDVMAVTLEDFALAEGGAGQEGAVYVTTLPEEVRVRLHVTVGTRAEEIRAVEAKTMVERWRAGEKERVMEVALDGMEVKAVVRGLND